MADSLLQELCAVSSSVRKDIVKCAVAAIHERMRTEAKKGELGIEEKVVMQLAEESCPAGASSKMIEYIIFAVFDSLEEQGFERHLDWFNWNDECEKENDTEPDEELI